MKDYRLCKHVMLKVDKKKKIALIMSGPVYPHFAWDKKREADTPRIKCSDCQKQIPIRGYIVERDPASRYTPRSKGASSGKSATRKQTRKPDQVNAEDATWRFLD